MLELEKMVVPVGCQSEQLLDSQLDQEATEGAPFEMMQDWSRLVEYRAGAPFEVDRVGQ